LLSIKKLEQDANEIKNKTKFVNMIRNEDISFIEYVDKDNMEKERLFESLKFDRIYREEMSEYGGYGYLINMNSVEFSIQEVHVY